MLRLVRILRDKCNATAGQLAIGIVEVEVPRELLRARFAGISAIAPLLFGGQERDRHPLSRDT